jgi:RHS repeat-associated protein
LSLSISARYASAAVGELRRISLYTPELNLMSETEAAVETTSGTPAVAYDYIWFGGKPVAQVDFASNTTHWTFTDHLGTPILETDATGTVDWRAEYEPFGTMYTLRTGTTRHQPLRFPGQESDAADGEREYNIHRWYRSGWGRYTQGDPIGLSGGSSNLYLYVNGSPETHADPDGMKIRGQIVTAGVADDLFLHAAIRIYDDADANDDTTYSHGGGAAGAQQTTTFVSRYDQLGEPVKAYDLKLTESEISRLQQLLNAKYPQGGDQPYNGAINNCAQSGGWAIELALTHPTAPGFFLTTQDLLSILEKQGIIVRAQERVLSMGGR